MQQATANKRIIIVLGMHRSGTSAITRALKVLGVNLGENLIQPISGNNEKGFFEDAEINALNEELLVALNSSWHSLSLIPSAAFNAESINLIKLRAIALIGERVGVIPFGFKDPRVSRLLPFWQSVFKQMKIQTSYIIAIRHPISVMQSLKKRDGFEFEKSGYLWLQHVLPSMLKTVGEVRVVVDYDLLLANPKDQLLRIANALHLTLDANSLAASEYSNDFLDNNLRHSQFSIDELALDAAVPNDVVNAYNMLFKLARDEISIKSAKIKTEFERLDASLTSLFPAFNLMTSMDKLISQRDDEITKTIKTVADQITELNELSKAVIEKDLEVSKITNTVAAQITELNELSKAVIDKDLELIVINAELNKLYSSKSWRVTEPLRDLRRFVSNVHSININSKIGKSIMQQPSLQRTSDGNNLPKLNWQDDSHLKINDVYFNLSCDTKKLQTGQSAENNFLLGKPRQMVEKSVFLGQQQKISKIFEMGILQGGSVVLYDQIFQPQKIAAVEYTPKPVDSLTNYIEKYNKKDVVKPYYGVNQADFEAMDRILISEFPDRDIDLIVDDASHLYDETRAAFNTAFPYLKKGGLYIIEDWAWAHWSGDYWQNGETPGLTGKTAMSNLLIELFMLTASRPDFISDISIDHNSIVVKRGKGDLPDGKFNITDHYLLRGKHFGAWL